MLLSPIAEIDAYIIMDVLTLARNYHQIHQLALILFQLKIWEVEHEHIKII